MALTKIYKSRDGLAAVSSNTSIMSEVSNISKSSLPSSIPATSSNANNTTTAPATTTSRHASIASSTGAAVKAIQQQHQQQQFQVPQVPPPTTMRHASLALPSSSSSNKLAASSSSTQVPSNNAVPSYTRIQSNSAKIVSTLSIHIPIHLILNLTFILTI